MKKGISQKVRYLKGRFWVTKAKWPAMIEKKNFPKRKFLFGIGFEGIWRQVLSILFASLLPTEILA